MKTLSLSANDFLPVFKSMDPMKGDLYLDSIDEEESFGFLFFNIDKNEKTLYRFPAHMKTDLLLQLHEKYPSASWPPPSFCDKDYLVPTHPLFKCDLFPLIDFDGDIVQSVSFKTGYRHLGMEQRLLNEGRDQASFLISQLNPSIGPSSNILWCIAVERLMNVDIPSRAKLVRMIFLELARIRSHLYSFLNLLDLLGLHVAYGTCLEKIHLLRGLFQSYGLSFAHPHLATPGGLFKDMPTHWIFDLKSFSKEIIPFLDYFEKNIVGSHLVYERLNLPPAIRAELLRYSASGPIVRASGIRWDNRKKNSLYYYHELDFEIPLGTTGHAYDRLLVRFEEIKESLSILTQICNFIPAGKFKEDFTLSGNAQVYSSIEAPEGELGLYLSMGNGSIQKVRIRSSAQAHLLYFQNNSRGLSLSDFLVDYCTYNISAEEFDR